MTEPQLLNIGERLDFVAKTLSWCSVRLKDHPTLEADVGTALEYTKTLRDLVTAMDDPEETRGKYLGKEKDGTPNES